MRNPTTCRPVPLPLVDAAVPTPTPGPLPTLSGPPDRLFSLPYEVLGPIVHRLERADLCALRLTSRRAHGFVAAVPHPALGSELGGTAAWLRPQNFSAFLRQHAQSRLALAQGQIHCTEYVDAGLHVDHCYALKGTTRVFVTLAHNGLAHIDAAATPPCSLVQAPDGAQPTAASPDAVPRARILAATDVDGSPRTSVVMTLDPAGVLGVWVWRWPGKATFTGLDKWAWCQAVPRALQQERVSLAAHGQSLLITDQAETQTAFWQLEGLRFVLRSTYPFGKGLGHRREAHSAASGSILRINRTEVVCIDRFDGRTWRADNTALGFTHTGGFSPSGKSVWLSRQPALQCAPAWATHGPARRGDAASSSFMQVGWFRLVTRSQGGLDVVPLDTVDVDPGHAVTTGPAIFERHLGWYRALTVGAAYGPVARANDTRQRRRLFEAPQLPARHHAPRPWVLLPRDTDSEAQPPFAVHPRLRAFLHVQEPGMPSWTAEASTALWRPDLSRAIMVRHVHSEQSTMWSFNSPHAAIRLLTLTGDRPSFATRDLTDVLMREAIAGEAL